MTKTQAELYGLSPRLLRLIADAIEGESESRAEVYRDIAEGVPKQALETAIQARNTAMRERGWYSRALHGLYAVIERSFKTTVPTGLDNESTFIAYSNHLKAFGEQLNNHPGYALTLSEINSRYSRVEHAEGLIEQLPPEHDGRNTWLMNYGIGAEATAQRRKLFERNPHLHWSPKHRAVQPKVS